MIRPIKTTALAGAIALALTACGGGTTGDTAGIGGSGFISTGTITGFGSVFVNGVEFETASSTFDIEGDSSETTQSDLAIGMVVRVNGTINPDGITGTATSIIFDDELQGPISTVDVSTPDSKTVTILGTSILIDRLKTSFDNTDFTSIDVGNNLEISGYYDSLGTLIASRVELETSSNVEVKGTILSLSGSLFTLNGINIDATSATLEDLPNGLEADIYVEVEGTYDSGSNTITASTVESEEFELSDSDEFELEGYITNLNTNNVDFKINGIPVNVSSAIFSPLAITLANDLKVEAEGSIVNGVLIANELKLRGGEITIAAEVTAVDTNTNTFQVTPVSGQPAITIGLGTETEMKNEITGDESLNIFDLKNTFDSNVISSDVTFVQIEGFENDTEVFAEQVKIVDIIETDGVEIQANIQETTTGDLVITVLGVAFPIDGGTIFENNNISISESDFNTAADSNPLISVTDSDFDGIADKAEIE